MAKKLTSASAIPDDGHVWKIAFSSDERKECLYTLFDVEGEGLSGAVHFPSKLKGFEKWKCYRLEWLTPSPDLTAVVIPEGVTFLSPGSFQGCKNLKSAVLPSTMHGVADYCFNDCEALENVYVLCGKEGWKEPSEWAFENCRSVKFHFVSSIDELPEELLPRTPEPAPAPAKPAKPKVLGKKGTIKKAAYKGRPNLDVVEIAQGVKEIGDEAFYSSSLSKIILPEGLERVGRDSFRNTELKSVKIPASVKVISVGAFWGCEELEEVEFAGAIEEIENIAFASCPKLKRVVVPAGTLVGDDAFMNSPTEVIRR